MDGTSAPGAVAAIGDVEGAVTGDAPGVRPQGVRGLGDCTGEDPAFGLATGTATDMVGEDTGD